MPEAGSAGMDAEKRAGLRSDFRAQVLRCSSFSLFTGLRAKDSGKPLRIYLEGDGSAWITRTRLSTDPTPKSRLVRNLAERDASENVAYVARPCQYVSRSEEIHYDAVYWSSKRFSEEVIQATDEAIDALKKEAGADRIELVGYSGGGAVAVLVAARRSDVDFIRTIAGNLDTDTFYRLHGVSALSGSLNPVQVAGQVASIPQEHYSSANDKVIPPEISEKFKTASGYPPTIRLVRVSASGHDSGWEAVLPVS